MRLSNDLSPGFDSSVVLDFPVDSQVVDEAGNPIDDASIADAVNSVIPAGNLPSTITYPGDPGDTWSIASVVKLAQDAVTQFRQANTQADRAASGQAPLRARSARVQAAGNLTPLLWIGAGLLAFKLLMKRRR